MSTHLFGDWDEWDRRLDGHAFGRRLTREVARANERIGLLGVRVIRKAIQGKRYHPNAPLTIAIKGSSTPLFDKGSLDTKITHDTRALDREVWIGVKRFDADVNIARALHEGFVIEVTPAVRAAVMAKLRDAKGTAYGAASAYFSEDSDEPIGTAFWIVPPRPFIERPLADEAFQGRALGHWRNAYSRALLGRAA